MWTRAAGSRLDSLAWIRGHREDRRAFRRVRGKALPDFARDIECTSWAELFLKSILAHPAVTCPIPATANPQHLADNLKAGSGRLLPDEAMQRRLVDFVGV